MKKFLASILATAMLFEMGVVPVAMALEVEVTEEGASLSTTAVDTNEVISLQEEAFFVEQDESEQLPEDYDQEASNVAMNEFMESLSQELSIMPMSDTEPLRVDVAFLIDTTGSMTTEISGVKYNIVKFAQYLIDRNVVPRLSLVEFRDIQYNGDDSTVIHTIDPSSNTPWTSTSLEMKSLLDTLTLADSRDTAETPWDAFGAITTDSFPWSDSSFNFAILLTDAYPKVNNNYGFTGVEDVKEALIEKDIITSVLTLSNYQSYYEDLVEYKGGFMGELSSNQDDYWDLLEQLGDRIIGVVEEEVEKKKAIYVIPGYATSKLYTDISEDSPYIDDYDDGKWIWANLTKIISNYTKDEGYLSFLVRDEYGNETDKKVKVDKDEDEYGIFDTMKSLYLSLEREFQDEYDVIYSPYNWLGDLNESVAALEEDIAKEKYTDVVLVTHSTGGLLAAAYIKDNSHMVEEAILIAPPLYGTVYPLSLIEQGLLGKFYDFAIYPEFIQDFSKNSPTTYQLLPSSEYISLYPFIQTTSYYSQEKRETIYEYENVTAMGSVYALMNTSPNINMNLTNHSIYTQEESYADHADFRDNSLDGNIVDVLRLVDPLIIGGTGVDTPANAEYFYHPDYTVSFMGNRDSSDGDGTLMLDSVFAKTWDVATQSYYYPFDSLIYDATHTKLLDETLVQEAVKQRIKGVTVTQEYMDNDGIVNQVRVVTKTNFNQNTPTIDSDYKPLNSTIEDPLLGTFEGSGFVTFDIYSAAKDATENYSSYILYYDDAYGEYSISYSLKGNDSNSSRSISSIDDSEEEYYFEIELSSLDKDGFLDKTVTIHRTFKESDIDDDFVIFEFNFDTTELTTTTIEEICETFESEIGYTVTVTDHLLDWDLVEGVSLEKNDSISMYDKLEGTDATKITENIVWSSSDESIAKISSTGKLTALDYGVTYIYAKLDNNKYSVSRVTVVCDSDSVEIEDGTVLLGKRLVLKPSFLPEKTTETALTYTGYDSDVVTIDNYGVVQGIAEGTTEVTATTSNGYSTAFTIEVLGDSKTGESEAVSSINGSSSITIGNSSSYSATVINVSDESVSWGAVDNDSTTLTLATMTTNSNNTVTLTALSAGTVKLTATSKGGYTHSIYIVLTEETVISTYTVTFDGNGGEVDVETMETGSDYKLSSLPTPTLDGYTFEGWFTTKTGSTEVTTDYTFSRDRTIYAHWIEDISTYTVKFDALGGIDKAVYLTTDEEGYIEEFPTPTHETLFFDGWYLTQNGGTEAVTEETAFTENTFLYARWKDAASYYGTYKNMITAKNTSGRNYGGTISSDNTNPMEGETVILTLNPSYRYTLFSISAVTSRGSTLSLKKISDTQYSFVQPAYDLEITAIFDFQSSENSI